MSVLYVVIPLAALLVAGAVAAFAWATSEGQLDDLDTPPARVLLEDDDRVASRERSTVRTASME